MPNLPSLLAQAAASEETTGALNKAMEFFRDFFSSGAIGIFLEGGIFMWPILILLILVLAVVIERYRSLKLLEVDSSKLREEVTTLLSEDRVEKSLSLCDRSQGPVPAVLSSGLRKYLVLRRLNYDQAQLEEQVIKSMENSGVHIVAALERHLPLLATIASVAPMLGFLGTVQGMIVAFGDIEANVGQQNIVQAAAAGIRVALLTTAFGLCVGIPAYMAFNYFTGIINNFVLQVESSAAELIEVVSLHLTLNKEP
ncbi:MAG: MotA/TolQ/ExbB proton channel family protein [Roseibacillus sp.]|nr:MotA/TolQ/ExbB proton channel family protein [Verrucomicrobiota bacterium]